MSKYKEYCSTCLSEGRNLTPARLFSSFFQEFGNIEIEDNCGLCWECKSMILKYDRFKHQVQIVQDIMQQKIKDTYDFIFSYNDHIKCTEYEFAVKDLKVESTNHIDLEDSSVDLKEDIYFENIDIKINDHNTIEIDESDDNRITKDNTDSEIQIHSFKEDIYVENIKINDHSSNDFNEANNAIGREEGVNANGIAKHNRDNEIQIVNEQNITNRTLKEDKTNANIHTKELLSKNDANVTLKNFNREHRTIEAKHNRVRIEKEVDKSPQKEFEEKFESILLSEEELSRIREEKRNHPNFKKVPYKCDSCVLGFLTKENYDLHLAKKHDKVTNKDFTTILDWSKAHGLMVNPNKTKVIIIGSCRLISRIDWLSLPRVLFDNVDIEISETVKNLGVVIDRELTPQDLDEHMRREHAFCCNECGTKFKGKHTLRSHKARVHAMKREYSCELCRKTFKRQSRLESHMAGHEAAVARRLAYCSICDIQYKNIYVYRSHLRNSVHHAETLYPCSECDKKFASKVYRTNHYNFYHLQKTKYKCDLCNKLLISAWRLKNHKQKYHGLTRPREHSCNLCDKKFFTRATLRGHVLTHSKERSFMCEDCGDTFKQKPALYTHSRQVHRGGRKVK
ncbi:hypothetical protein K1T71_000703 [Dendrolimus kikuchii]|uniref:Uncharacterized protein n=1 Tax=Dendrolimus kikuchii TaxID=765133 RepID=A0ACC1DK69_9NEOP|nr:hypothetical protein K1T71_000703 [Dendrolimus kikuchii]